MKLQVEVSVILGTAALCTIYGHPVVTQPQGVVNKEGVADKGTQEWTDSSPEPTNDNLKWPHSPGIQSDQDPQAQTNPPSKINWGPLPFHTGTFNFTAPLNTSHWPFWKNFTGLETFNFSKSHSPLLFPPTPMGQGTSDSPFPSNITGSDSENQSPFPYPSPSMGKGYPKWLFPSNVNGSISEDHSPFPFPPPPMGKGTSDGPFPFNISGIDSENHGPFPLPPPPMGKGTSDGPFPFNINGSDSENHSPFPFPPSSMGKGHPNWLFPSNSNGSISEDHSPFPFPPPPMSEGNPKGYIPFNVTGTLNENHNEASGIPHGTFSFPPSYPDIKEFRIFNFTDHNNIPQSIAH